MSDPSLYVHIPFCETKCPYCDFNSFGVEGRDTDGYMDALRLEMDQRGVPRNPPTLFVGGGTPTVLAPAQLDRFFEHLLRRVVSDGDREFTVEANPGSLDRDKLDVLRAHGVNRLSLGAQSFFDRHLRTLGRVHDVAHIEEAFGMAQDAGFREINLDFIYAVPGMTRHDWAATLERALALQPPHLSCYALIFEPGTEFHARRSTGSLSPIDEADELKMFRYTERRLRAAGLRRYEISNFARPGSECRHNLGYWRNHPYAGYGAGAWSFLDGRRLGNARNLEAYAKRVRERGDAFVSEERLQPWQAAAEEVVLALRTREGADLARVGVRHAVPAAERFGPIADRLRAAGLLEPESGRVRLSRRGWRLADAVSAEFLASERS